jgi:hypothetical protein
MPGASSSNLEVTPAPSMINSNEMPNIALKTLLEEPNDIMKYVAELEIQPLHGCCHDFYMSNVVCDDPISMAMKTYHCSTAWMKQRQFRITGSRCYSIFTYGKNVKSKWEKKSLQYFWPKPFRNANMEYGIACEAVAKDAYRKHYNCEILQVGLVISQANPWLAYSPDGIILDANGRPQKLLEIKCIVKGNNSKYL